MITPQCGFVTYQHKHGSKVYSVRAQSRQRSWVLLAHLVGRRKNLLVVEIGVFGGAHLLQLAEHFQFSNLRLVGIDPWEQIDVFNGTPSDQIDDHALVADRRELFRQNRVELERIVKECRYDQLTLLQSTSGAAAGLFQPDTIDILHVDGDHSEEGVFADLSLYWPKMAPGGVIVGDDWQMDTVKRGVRRFLATMQDPPELLVLKDPATLADSTKFLLHRW